MEKNILKTLSIALFIFISIIIINTLSSIYFMPILLIGSVFILFTQCLIKKYYYYTFLITLIILFIELNNGFPLFSLILLFIFLYLYIIPRIKKVISFKILNYYIYILLLYVGIVIIWYFSNRIETNFTKIILFNILLDCILIGIFL